MSNNNKTWMVIVNPNAGRQKGARDWEKISILLRQYKIDFGFAFTSFKEHAIELTKAYLEEGYKKFIVVGGDGTLNEVLNGIFRQDKIATDQFLLAVIPIGSGNDWCRMFNVPNDYEEAVRLIKQESTFLQDVGLVSFFRNSVSESRYFINVAGVGYDAIVAFKTNKDKERGKGGAWLYFKNLLTSLVSYKFTSTEITTSGDKDRIRTRMFSLSVGVCRYNGGGMKQLPHAIPDDGMLDLTLIKKLGKFSVLKEVKNLYDGSFINHPSVETLVSDHFKIISDPPVMLEADGESLGFSPFTFDIIPRSIKVVIGRVE
jgi:YegS/Rv2252/BmrU family lipid kinase